MSNKRGVLYPAFHKFYSALNSLEKFEKGTNFFDNITYLDNFFSEYRNITFVLQKSLANTKYISAYEILRDQYLVNEVGRWFVDKRNTVLKQQPFDLEKRIAISIYSDVQAVELDELTFTIDNDVEYSTIIHSLRKTFLEIDPLEVMFSAEFFFNEHGYAEDLYDNFITGINQMKEFLAEMKKAINEQCSLSDELEKKINSMNFYQVPKDMLMVDDYVFYCKKNRFEKASRVAMWVGSGPARVPLEKLNKTYPDGDLFDKFELMHLVIYQLQKTLLPTCLIEYSDNTFELISFGFSIKTTVYRKLNEISKRIEPEEIITVLFVNEMYLYSKDKISDKDSSERVKYAHKEILLFSMVDKDLSIKIRGYDIKRIDDFQYIASVMFSQPNKYLLPGFMNPVTKTFARAKGL
jgi:hypothetical protein